MELVFEPGDAVKILAFIANRIINLKARTFPFFILFSVFCFQYALLYLAFIGGAYVLNYTRVAILLLVVQYVVEALFHACRILSYADKGEAARPLYRAHDTLFVLGRLASIALSVLTFWYGLALAPQEKQVVDFASGNFNTALVR